MLSAAARCSVSCLHGALRDTHLPTRLSHLVESSTEASRVVCRSRRARTYRNAQRYTKCQLSLWTMLELQSRASVAGGSVLQVTLCTTLVWCICFTDCDTCHTTTRNGYTLLRNCTSGGQDDRRPAAHSEPLSGLRIAASQRPYQDSFSLPCLCH